MSSSRVNNAQPSHARGHTFTFPGVHGGTIKLSFNDAGNAKEAGRIASGLALARIFGRLDVVDYTGGTSIPTVPSGHTQELVLASSVAGSITVPAAPSGTQQILVVTNTAPITIHGSPGLQIIGGGSANIDVTDPTSIILADVGGATDYADLVSVPAADSPYVVAMRDGKETVYASGSGSISGGILGSTYINLTAAGAGTSNVILSQGVGDTVLTGSGNTTVTSSGTKALVQDGTGNFTENDRGLQDTIAALDASLASITTGGSQALVLGGAASINYLDTGSHDTMFAAGSALNATISGHEAVLNGGTGILTATDSGRNDTIVAGSAGTTAFVSGKSDLVLGAHGPLSVNASGSTNLTVSGGTGSETVNAGSAANILVYGATGGLDFIGGSGHAATIVGEAASNKITAGRGGLVYAAGAAGNSTIVGASRIGHVTLFGGDNAALTYVSSLRDATLVAATGNETLDASGSTKRDILWAGQTASDRALLIAGSGADTLVAGHGTDTLAGGSGGDLFAFTSGHAGGGDVITNFIATDRIELYGYGTAAASAALSSAVSAAGNTTLTLNDNTRITFIGVSSASALSGHIFST